MPDRLAQKIAYFLPQRIVYWAFIRVCAHATTGEYSTQIVPELDAMTALKRWGSR